MAYITVEVLYRGYSFFIMGICGGLAFPIIDSINNRISWDLDILLQGVIGSAVITTFEFIIGELSLHNILPIMWNYSNTPINYKGIICLPFSFVWFLLSIAVVILADCINYYILNEEEIPYYKMFGKTILKFKSK